MQIVGAPLLSYRKSETRSAALARALNFSDLRWGENEFCLPGQSGH
jgi:hypothetical protein